MLSQLVAPLLRAVRDVAIRVEHLEVPGGVLVGTDTGEVWRVGDCIVMERNGGAATAR